MTAEPPGRFAATLRGLRTRARLTQQELADRAGLSLRTVSDLERGVATAPQRETVRLLADTLSLLGSERMRFETSARGRPLAVPSQALSSAAIQSLPRDIASFTGRQRELRQLAESALRPSDPGVRDIARLCGYLPLAVGMLARQLRDHPAWSAAGRAAELAAARDRLALMEAEHLSVAAAFDLSYATLSEGQRRLFRRLGLHPGPDIDSYAAAALDGISLPAARRGLESLYDQYLLAEPVQGRFLPHDLIREHARALAHRVDPSEERDAALTRLLDYYQHASAIANAAIHGRPRRGPAADGVGPGAVPALTGMEQSLAWAHALAGLGRCALAAGPAAAGEALLREALEIFQRIGAAEARELLDELTALTGPPPV